MNRNLPMAYGLSALVIICPAVSMPTLVPAESSMERVAIMLTGDTCLQVRPEIEARLRRIDGVVAVDGGIAPGHLFVDVRVGKVTGDELTASVNNGAQQGWLCRAEAMRSCITADTGSTAAR